MPAFNRIGYAFRERFGIRRNETVLNVSGINKFCRPTAVGSDERYAELKTFYDYTG